MFKPFASLRFPDSADRSSRISFRARRWLGCCVLQGLLLGPYCAAASGATCDENAERPQAPNFVALAAKQRAAVVSVTTAREDGDGEIAALSASPDRRTGQVSAEGITPTRLMPARGSVTTRKSAIGMTYMAASGFIIDSNGYVLTSAHVILPDQDTWVTLSDGRQYPARAVGLDRLIDVALLKIDAGTLFAVELGDSSELCIGEWVAAIGAPFGFSQSLTVGVVSASLRPMSQQGGVAFLQSDVALNPGNSGGPLFNTRGRVVGMNTSMYSLNGGSSGVSFSVPSNLLRAVFTELRQTGRVVRGQIGARSQPMTSALATAFGTSDVMGALVTRVVANSPAARAGLRSGDIIRSVDGSAPLSFVEVQERIYASRAGQRLNVDVWRHGELVPVRISSAEMASEAAPAPHRQGPAERELGLDLVDVEPSANSATVAGLYVRTVTARALHSGIEVGDRVLAANDVSVSDRSRFDSLISAARTGKPLALLVQRGEITNYFAIGTESVAPILPH